MARTMARPSPFPPTWPTRWAPRRWNGWKRRSISPGGIVAPVLPIASVAWPSVVAHPARAAFNIDEINDALLTWGSVGEEAAPGSPGLPVPLTDLVTDVRTASERLLLLSLIEAAGLDQPVLVGAVTAERMVRPYSWLLDRVGADGIRLSQAGYLPPVHVAAASAELGLADEWIGKGKRENQTGPVQVLRETAQRIRAATQVLRLAAAHGSRTRCLG
jgi:hypothetical protein